jgi:hypothetical protein
MHRARQPVTAAHPANDEPLTSESLRHPQANTMNEGQAPSAGRCQAGFGGGALHTTDSTTRTGHDDHLPMHGVDFELMLGEECRYRFLRVIIKILDKRIFAGYQLLMLHSLE